MADPTTINRGYAIPARGTDAGVWDIPVNGDFNLIDQNLGAVSNVALSNANVTLSPAQYACGTIRLIGVLTAAISVIFPAVQGWWTIDNQTTGAFVATISIGSGQVIAVEQGAAADILIDGVNVKFRNLPPVGTYLDVCDATVPAWITACTVLPYLNCNGSTFNATTYPYLNAKLGTNTLPDFRGVVPGYLNQGTGRITTGGSGINGDVRFSIGGTEIYQLLASQIPSITVSGVIAVFSTIGNIISGAIQSLNNGTGSGGVFQGIQNGTASSGTVQSNGTATLPSINTGNGTHQNMPPTTIGGIRLIRAA